eukprot:scaffold3289_cov163-Amphora_coffeaeformis.AAC.11
MEDLKRMQKSSCFRVVCYSYHILTVIHSQQKKTGASKKITVSLWSVSTILQYNTSRAASGRQRLYS